MRHVSAAFGEDPVRILRAARFAARFGFIIAPETLALMRDMVANGEVDALVAERVWQELARGLMEKKPSLLFRDAAQLRRACEESCRKWTRCSACRSRSMYHPEIDCGSAHHAGGG